MAEYRRNTCSRPVSPMPRPMPVPPPGPSCPLPPDPEHTCMDNTVVREPLFDRKRFPVAMCYVPRQAWCEPYGLEQGLKNGTIFPDLNKPFRGIRKGGCCK